jgi:hypothetical protein
LYQPLDFLARLAALVPTPQVNLARYHGVFAHGAPTVVVAGGVTGSGLRNPLMHSHICAK